MLGRAQTLGDLWLRSVQIRRQGVTAGLQRLQSFQIYKLSISKAVSLTIHETGISMIYTAIILTTGFAIFGFSDFGGTAALGILLSLTLLIAYTSNLILLPCFLLSLEKSILKKEILNVPVFDIENEDDED